SDDFLVEIKRAVRDKPSGNLELILMIPNAKRNRNDENIIKKRLIEHFKRHHKLLHEEKSKITEKGIIFTVAGIIIMLLAAYFFFEKAEYSLIDKFLLILMEPAGWFLFWEGLDQVIFESKKKTPDLEFYEKMIKCEINFIGYQ
ncbi:MAG: hypothetical protein PHU12_03755, partial [Candidatus Aenigmarchaeota archaeon]|nr:hypothetical protein [Candidatus Aenigmarchaeota archaeon]